MTGSVGKYLTTRPSRLCMFFNVIISRLSVKLCMCPCELSFEFISMGQNTVMFHDRNMLENDLSLLSVNVGELTI